MWPSEPSPQAIPKLNVLAPIAQRRITLGLKVVLEFAINLVGVETKHKLFSVGAIQMELVFLIAIALHLNLMVLVPVIRKLAHPPTLGISVRLEIAQNFAAAANVLVPLSAKRRTEPPQLTLTVRLPNQLQAKSAIAMCALRHPILGL